MSIARNGVDRGVGVQRTLSGRTNGRHEGMPAAEQWMGGSGELGRRLSVAIPNPHPNPTPTPTPTPNPNPNPNPYP